jgi:hypothetical protein
MDFFVAASRNARGTSHHEASVVKSAALVWFILLRVTRETRKVGFYLRIFSVSFASYEIYAIFLYYSCAKKREKLKNMIRE